MRPRFCPQQYFHRCRSAAEVAIPGAEAQIPPLRGPSRAGQGNGGRGKREWRGEGEVGKDEGGVGNERGRGIGKRGPIHNAKPRIKNLRWPVLELEMLLQSSALTSRPHPRPAALISILHPVKGDRDADRASTVPQCDPDS